MDVVKCKGFGCANRTHEGSISVSCGTSQDSNQMLLEKSASQHQLFAKQYGHGSGG